MLIVICSIPWYCEKIHIYIYFLIINIIFHHAAGRHKFHKLAKSLDSILTLQNRKIFHRKNSWKNHPGQNISFVISYILSTFSKLKRQNLKIINKYFDYSHSWSNFFILKYCTLFKHYVRYFSVNNKINVSKNIFM